MAKDIFEQIHTDHVEVGKLIDQLLSNPGRGSEQLIDKIASELLPHAKAEEMTLYPWLGEHAQARSVIQQSIEEHREVENLMNSYDDVIGNPDQVESKTNQLQMMIQQHVAKEESTVFDLARDLLSQDQIDEMSRRFPQDKDRFREQWRMAA